MKTMIQENMLTQETMIANPMVPALYRVERFIKETADTFTIGLCPAGTTELDGATYAAMQVCTPGQFNMLYVFGMGEVPICISGTPAECGLLTHTTRAVGGITRAMSALKVGDMMGVRGPFGSHWPIEESLGKDMLIVAGGMGLAPLRPAIQALLARRSDFGKITILNGMRTATEVIFKDDLKKWDAQKGVDLYVGSVRKTLQQITINPANTVAMICGPDILMHFSVDVLQRAGMSAKEIYVSMERNMKCAIGFCGHCQFGRHFVCKDGAVFSYNQLAALFSKPEI